MTRGSYRLGKLNPGFSFKPLSGEYDIVLLPGGLWKFDLPNNPFIFDSVKAGLRWMKVMRAERITIMPGAYPTEE